MAGVALLNEIVYLNTLTRSASEGKRFNELLRVDVVIRAALQCTLALWLIPGMGPTPRLCADHVQPEELRSRLLRSAAWVLVNRNPGTSMGTGIVVDRARKLLITNNHVVDTNHRLMDNVNNVFVYFPLIKSRGAVAGKKEYIRFDRPVRGKVVAVDAKRDLAVVELELVTPEALAVRFASRSPQPNDKIYLIGNPGSSEQLWEANSGVVVGVSRQHVIDAQTRRQIDTTLVEIKTEEPVLRGYSGGPVVNEAGELIGVTTRSNPAAHRAYAVDISEVKDIVGLVRGYPRENRLLDPRSADDYLRRGVYYLGRHRDDSAIVDFGDAAERDPKKAAIYSFRGEAYEHKKEYERARSDFEEALRLDPDNLRASRELAWLCATCPQQQWRDGKRAVELAGKACALSSWKDGACLDTLAAAYAEVGKFQEAIEWEKKALALVPDDERTPFRERLEFYRRGEPFRQR
jgi:cytochrome c-type biogenesis protein CcmH/NrfG/V8-like Glu-specific endopeptidase